MRRTRSLYAAAALTTAAAAAVIPANTAGAETVNVQVGNVTVAATWRAQPAAINEGDSTTFKLALTASGNAATTNIKFGQSTFHFSSGSATSDPLTKDVVLNATSPSSGNTLSTALPSFAVTYFQDGAYSATMSTSAAPVSWKQGAASRSGTYSLNIATTVSVGDVLPSIQSANVPVMITKGEGFNFSALATDPGLYDSLSYRWDFDYDGTFAADATQQNPNFAYGKTGLHQGMLRVYDDHGYTPFEFAVNVLEPPRPQAVPLPAAVWGGLGLMAAVGMIRGRMARRGGNDSDGD